MSHLDQAATEFLSLGRVAVVGVSRSSKEAANAIYRKLKTGDRRVYAVNPNAETVEGDPCFPDVASIPGGVEGAVIATRPELARAVVDECAAAGVRQIWFHRSFGPGSVSAEAVERCRELGLRAIPGACPMMYCQPVDPGHKCIRFLARLTGKLPRPVGAPTGD